MILIDSEIPEHDKHAVYNRSDKGRTRTKRYRRDRIATRPFVAWDGEGISIGGEHQYVLLASSRGDRAKNTKGLTAKQIFDPILRSSQTVHGINVVYGAGYDFNLWLKACTTNRPTIDRLRHGHMAMASGYRLRWKPGKSLWVSDGRRSAIVYDVISFFQRSFISACDLYLGNDWPYRDKIIANKARRDHFTVFDLPEIIEYNDAELQLLVMLCEKLRDHLTKVDILPSRWDGPGAAAAALMRREGVREAIGNVPDAVENVAQYAYAGGRFEVFQAGIIDKTCYEYDLCSAYPAALREVPDLSRGTWVHSDRPIYEPGKFAVYRAHFSYDWLETINAITSCYLPYPLYRRLPSGNVCYPNEVTGWYWSPDIGAAMAYVAFHGGTLDLTESWTFEPADNSRPFAFVNSLYLERQARKRDGDASHLALKLALNSLYGKTAQQIGWGFRRGRLTKPPYHCLPWAGFVTSWTRASIFTAIVRDLESVIAFETDALFSTRPLWHLTIGDGLGEWSRTKFDYLVYLQSGTYFGVVDGEHIARTRGVDKGSLTEDDIYHAIIAKRRTVTAYLTRFIGAGYAARTDWDKWGQWERKPRELRLIPAYGKRFHAEKCLDCYYHKSTSHRLIVNPCAAGESEAYPLAWRLIPDTMLRLAEMTAEGREDMGDVWS